MPIQSGILLGVVISAPALVPFTLFGDVVDAAELKYKKRVGGNMGGFINFVSQIGSAVGLSVTMIILGFAGFTEQDLTQPPLTGQPESALWAIRLVFSLAPLLLMGIGIYTSLQYNITSKRHRQINEAIKAGNAKLEYFSDVL